MMESLQLLVSYSLPLESSGNIKKGDRVIVIRPAYVAGMRGEVCGQEILANNKPSSRWLIQVTEMSLVLSLKPSEFQVIHE